VGSDGIHRVTVREVRAVVCGGRRPGDPIRPGHAGLLHPARRCGRGAGRRGGAGPAAGNRYPSRDSEAVDVREGDEHLD